MIALQRIRTRGIDWTAGALNWVSDTFLAEDDYTQPISLRNRCGWWLEDLLHRVFSLFWTGSDEEVASALRGECPRRYLDSRLRQLVSDAFVAAALHKWDNLFDDFFCADCDEELLVSEEGKVCAECRALRPEMLLEDRKAAA